MRVSVQLFLSTAYVAENLIKEARKTQPDAVCITKMYNFYGSTESGCTSIYNVPNRKKNCIGKQTHNVIAILTDEHRNAINKAIDASGLLATEGSMNMLGYWRDEAETKKF